MIAKTQEDIDGLRAAGKLLAHALYETAKLVAPGVTTASLDLAAEKFIRDGRAVPAFLNYKQEDSVYPFPASLCVSINDEVVHGIPSEERVIQDGDLVMLDLGLKLNGYFSDMAVTVIAGEGTAKDKALVAATEEAFAAALKTIKPGARMGDIGAAIEAVGKKYGFAVVDDLGGHSLGKVAHEPPFVSNTGVAGTGIELTEGLVLAIEPIFTAGKPDIELLDDQWTFVTADGSRSSETEHTVIVTKNGAEVLTK